jgi:hypothetical protein
LSNNIIALIPDVLALLSLGIFAYAAYWAFNIRRAQTVRIYRNQALGMGFVSLAWILVFFNYVVVFHSGLYGLFVLFDSLIIMMAFYWVDASVLAARRSDPLLRDTLHWQKLRVYLWGLLVASAAVVVFLTAYYEYVIGVEPQFMLNLPLGLTTGVVSLPSQEVVYPSIIALPIAAYRSRDVFFRRSLAWFAAFIVMIEIVGSFGTSSSFLPTLGVFGSLTIAAYCIYRSVKSLVPLNRISPQEIVPKAKPPPP